MAQKQRVYSTVIVKSMNVLVTQFGTDMSQISRAMQIFPVAGGLSIRFYQLSVESEFQLPCPYKM